MKLKKIFSIILAITILSTLFSGLSSIAFADGEIPVLVDLSAEDTQIMAGQSFTVDISFDFEDIAAAGGISVFRFSLNYDTEVLEPVDPETLLPIVYNEDGTIAEGKYYIFGEIGMQSALSVAKPEDGKFVLLYGATDPAADIFLPGVIAQFAFCAKKDLTINNSLTTLIEIGNPEVIQNDKNVPISVSKNNLGINILPPFETRSMGNVYHEDTLTLAGLSIIGTDSGFPMYVSIADASGNVIEEKEATLSMFRYNVVFEITEELYPAGEYKVIYSYKDITKTENLSILAKYVPPAPPVVDDPSTDEPDTPPADPDDPDDEGDNNNSNNNNSNNNNNGGSHTGGGIPVAPGKDEQTPVDKPVEKPTDVVYPSDIASHWAEENIKYVYDNKLMNGYEDGTFGAEQSITRAEFATVISRLLGLSEAPDGASFADCTEHWAKGYIGALAAQGIVGGVNDTDFAPDENITREQIAVILSRALKLEEPFDSMAVFMDEESISDWAYADVYKVLEAGYMKGDDLGNFNPLANATRAEVATVIYRLHSAK